MTTEYQHTATVAVPSDWISDTNHLALLLGESDVDINTFTDTSHTDGTMEYAVSHAVVKSVFLEPTVTGTLPVTPVHATDILDRAAAQRAFDSLNQPGGIRLAIDVDPHVQFAAWGFEVIKNIEEESTVESSPL